MVVAALAGRRIDPTGALPARFPLSSVDRVRADIERLLVNEKVDLLVCSAASGSDLIALDVAQSLKVRCRVILPFDEVRFRQTSVVDSSPDWGLMFDKIIAAVKAQGDLLILERKEKSDDAAYDFATEVIINEAKQASPYPALALLIWDGESRGGNDFAEQFRRLSAQAGMTLRVVLTK